MQNLKDTIQIEYYLGLVIKYRWLLIIPFCIAMVVGIYLAVTLPKVYEANTLILVEPQRVPSNYVKSIVTQDIESRISTISQQILSRTNLEKIMDAFQLFSEPQHENMFKEDKLEALRKRINIQVSRVRAGNDTFSISYRGTHPQTTMKVTNALATYFIDENLKVRESHATGTNLFLDEELKTVRQRLAEIEEKMKIYRTRYMGELPEQLQSNLTILSRLQEQLTEKQKSLRETRAMMASMEQQMSQMSDLQFNDSLVEIEGDIGAEGGGSFEIDQLKEQLAALKLKYTDRHPDVVRLKNTIAQLEQQNEAATEAGAAEVASEPEIPTESMGIGFENLQNIQQQEMRREIGQQRAEIAQLMEQVKMYQQRVENTPLREQELLSLERDYDNIKDSYNSLVQRKLEAEIAVNMEKKQKGEQFRIIDHAALPEKPYSPNMQMLFLFSVAAGLGIGGGLIFLIDFFNSSLKRPKDYETELGLAVLATIPRLYQPRDKMLDRINLGLTVASLVVAAALTTVFAVLIVKGVEPTLEVLRLYAGI